MDEASDRRPLSWQERGRALGYWAKLGLSKRHANSLINAGFTTLNDVKSVSDFDLRVIPNVGNEGLAQLYRLMERKPPGILRTAAERRGVFEGIWRSRLGDERFDRLINEIVAMAGGDLDKVNGDAAQALWNIARRRRAKDKT